ncbi:glycoside hydrolase family 88 protein [Sphingobacterium sp. DN00404]|uniref:Glycoside hydrolase family 88 protein n=1 Tax=Sphingobacterium micropteri TaxID=2763501 RepID=A0ABR7YL10_9SPHI|nr:glycoside hydrolase family 88 protein [Sphingobacterium micropteri]MBD1431997.1 glycoside hydrolase family 88 protein [Sphingobacterium micropteri]
MNRYIWCLVFVCYTISGWGQSLQDEKIVADATEQLRYLVEYTEQLVQDSTRVSPRTLENGELELVRRGDWTSGFYPGILWQMFDLTRDEQWKDWAQTATARIEREKENGRTHDMGFKVYNSFGKGYQLTGDSHYREVIVHAAKTLSSRFNPTVGCIRSWDHNADKWQFPVIIDNMLNLELLFATTKLTGDSTYYQMAVSHAGKTLENHFRKDGGSYHVVDYDPKTGEVKHRHTHQGHAHESTWARGQAWAIYGFTMCYRETGEERFLKKALALFSWLSERLPEDGVAYWDFDVPTIPKEPRDASAAAVMASALYELDYLVPHKPALRELADRIMTSLTDSYRNEKGTSSGFLLGHSTGSKPHHSEVDVPLIYADYYYLEALLRKNGKF